MSGSGDNTCQFSLQISHQLPICGDVGASRWGESPCTHPGIASDPWRTDVNVAHANATSLCGYIVQGDGGITQGLQSQFAAFCVCYRRASGQYHAPWLFYNPYS